MSAVSSRRMRAWVAAVGAAGEPLIGLDDSGLRAEADRLRTRAEAGEPLDALLPEAFAVVRETSARLLGQRHYDVQVMGGVALHAGAIAEMGTGEGKTLVAALPSFLHALPGQGVHVVTANDYLAARDAEKVGRVLGHLGLSVGTVVASVPRHQRPPEYAADVTYATSTELGFDYLYDNLVLQPGEEVQRGLHAAFVDEVDSVLIDEARTPLIIAEEGEVDEGRYRDLADLVRGWRTGTQYEVEPSAKWAWLLDPGVDALQEKLGVDNVFEHEHVGTLHLVNTLLRASQTYLRDRDYVVVDGEVMIVDPNTGRVLPGRRFEQGLHQAIEALEGVKIHPETITLASVTLQNFFRLYDHLGGMTGTARQEREEFERVYSLSYLSIPPHRPARRVDRPDVLFRTRRSKYASVVAEARRRHERGQPVLIGTASVRASEEISEELGRAGIHHRVLNAKRLAEEAEVIAVAGRLGAVTVATDMAGRGTDIALGGSAEERTRRELEEQGHRPGGEGYDDLWRQTVERHHRESRAERDRVLELGGLFVLATERHDSRRIDDQLRGRCGRQGDPGETQFFVSLEDELVLEHELRRMRRLLSKKGPDKGSHRNAEVLSDPKLVRLVADAQAAAENRDRKMRKQMLDYDALLREQRAVVYRNRRRLLHSEDLDDWLDRVVRRAVRRMVRKALGRGAVTSDDLDQLAIRAAWLYPHNVDVSSLHHRHAGRHGIDADGIVDEFEQDARLVLQDRRRWWGREQVASTARRTALEAIDVGWREHLTELEGIRAGIHLRSIGQRDPLVEYRLEGQRLFRSLERSVREVVTRAVLRE